MAISNTRLYSFCKLSARQYQAALWINKCILLSLQANSRYSLTLPLFLFFLIHWITAKFCEEPITVTTTGRWDCELPDGSELAAGEKPPVGTRCRLACLPGLALHLNLPTPSPATFYHRFHYDVLRDEPEVVVKENQLIIKCLATGQWSEGKSYLDMISCVSSNCPRLLAPEHGSLFPEACQEEGVPLHSQCLVLCSAGFYPRNGRIRTCSKSLKWFPEENTICLRLPPTPRPYIHCPSDLIVDLKAGQSSTHVIIPQPQANYAYRYAYQIRHLHSACWLSFILFMNL